MPKGAFLPLMAPPGGYRIHPQVLVWARESAGVTLQSAASRGGLRADELASWEGGRRTPSLAQLRELANLYKRPLAALLLPRAPETAALPSDFRLLPEDEREPLSEAVYLAVREARRLARAWKELRAETADGGRWSLGRATLSQNPEAVAERTRSLLGVSLADQAGWKDERTALRRWRTALESHGVLAFQFTIPVKEARGFSIREGEARLVVMNSRDAVAARIFTVFHELGHLLLGEDGICLFEGPVTRSKAASIEAYCNRFAAELLLPRTSLLGHPVITRDRASGTYADGDLTAVAREFKVSREVVLGRLFHLRLVDRASYEARRSEWRGRVKPKATGGRRDPPRDCLRRLGSRFVATVLEGHRRGILTRSDVADYLGLKLKHLATLERIAAVDVA